MIIQPIFSNFFSEVNLLEKVNNDELYSKYTNKLSNNSQINLFKEEIEELWNSVEYNLNIIKKEVLGINDKYTIGLKEAWINKNQPSNIVDVHHHAGYFLSAVYYVNAKAESSFLSFMNNNIIIEDKIPQATHDNVLEKFNMFNCAKWNVESKTGNLVIFPSWLKHQVVNYSDDNRISIAFNSLLLDHNNSSNYYENKLLETYE